MRAAIVAIGSELLGTRRLDTNSLKLTEVLERHGVELWRKSVVGDLEAELAAELAGLAGACDLVLITGGLGPTADDVTRSATAVALGRSLSLDEEIVAGIAERFRRIGVDMPEVNRRQGEVIAGAQVLDNPLGTAPGQRLEEKGTTFFLFPGVPTELMGMIDRFLEPWLQEVAGGVSREKAVLKVACVPESALEERIAPAYEEFGREAITVLAKPGDITLHLWAQGDEAHRGAHLQTMSARLRELVGSAVYATGEGATLEGTVGRLLTEAGATVVTAESCTGGLVAERLTRVAGSSAYFLGAIVAYSNAVKRSHLGVPEELLAAHGAVSEEVARAMAEGARQRLGGDFALALTGIAGPGGGSEEKPVGTVHIAVAGPGEIHHRRICYPVDRERVRRLSSQVALEMLRRRLTGD